VRPTSLLSDGPRADAPRGGASENRGHQGDARAWQTAMLGSGVGGGGGTGELEEARVERGS
jgi:hypothetical protein